MMSDEFKARLGLVVDTAATLAVAAGQPEVGAVLKGAAGFVAAAAEQLGFSEFVVVEVAEGAKVTGTLDLQK
jgi:hypothetical protein